ncbi:F-box/LRR-repeat protein 12-like [Amphiura filiformis]|uniref:F-box/LRR-repeat protein 12-like n=1 Tax=Amphiura filiformis TaxID=82378 RepID=UPI003B225A3E
MDPASTSSRCSFDNLPDDALIIIFSFLTLCERLMVMRVSKRWNRILSNSQAWTHVDFWDERQTTEKPDEHGKTWRFPNDKNSVLDFMRKYTSGRLKSIRLHVISKDILSRLQQYRKLETFRLLAGRNPLESAFHFEVRPDNYLDDKGPLYKELFLRLGKLKNLRCLTFQRMYSLHLTPEYLDPVSNLQEITDLEFVDIFLEDGRYQFGTDLNANIIQLRAAMVILLKLTKVKSFRFSLDEPNPIQAHVNFDVFLRGIADKWKNLRQLTLVGIRPPSRETFKLLVSALTQLQELELYGKMITDENIALIATHLKKLTSLKLTDGQYTSTGIRGLCGHPSIERLYVRHSQHNQAPEWLLAVYDVIISLPHITYVKILGYRVISLHAQHKIPALQKNVQIEVENSPIRLQNCLFD